MQGSLDPNTEPDIEATKYVKRYEFKELERKKTLVLNVWDTPGGANFVSTRDVDYAHCDVALLVYSIDKDSTFDELQEFYDDVLTFNRAKKPKFFLVGNKADLDAKGLR